MLDPITIGMLIKGGYSVVKHLTGDSDKDKPILDKVVEVAKDVTGINNPADAIKAIAGNKEASEAFRLALLDKDKEFEVLRVKNVINARDTEIRRLEAGSKNRVQSILALSAAFGFFAMVGYVIAFGLADMSKEGAFIVGNITGLAGAIAKDVYHYYFGSSSGSKEKTRLLKEGV